ncbi:class I SAM-dependent methyltransferase [Legionella brunensis]|uniref:Putative Methyltransferase n=1 Tax=Legionella brunensis TaxID=29422 RepID=A0A0W0SNK4_9GAMM|nr:methyltransferase [Legionella brunensis]KTC84959.1 putative Methyltransferase [Legionella brunensis]
MDFLEFYQAIRNIFKKQRLIDYSEQQININNYFLSELDRLIAIDEADSTLKMTWLSILFEGFYRHLGIGDLKQDLLEVKIKRWKQHFGSPTVLFLLSYKREIDATQQLFHESNYLKELMLDFPWFVNKGNFVADPENTVFINPESISYIDVPHCREAIGMFTQTHNPFGGFTTAPCDPVSQQFIAHASLIAKNGGRILEIGAAFGAATLEVIAQGATTFCNDISPENLAVVQQRFLEAARDQKNSLTGDSNELVLIPGEFPNELAGLPENFFDAILICRVLHFFSGKKIEESLALIVKLLVPNGKIYIVCETPYLKNWQRFIPEFNSRIERNVEWPGEISSPADYESSGRAKSLPPFVHWITKEVLERSLLRAELTIEYSEYINRIGQFPEDLLLPEYGKESVGVIGIKMRDMDYDTKSKLV